MTEKYLRDEIERAFRIKEWNRARHRPEMPGNPKRILDQVGRRHASVLLRWLYEDAMPDAVDHLALAAFVNERAEQPVPLFHLQWVSLQSSYDDWMFTYNLLLAASQLISQAKQSRPVGNRPAFYPGWNAGMIPHTPMKGDQLLAMIRDNRNFIEYNAAPWTWTGLSEDARNAAATLRGDELHEFKVSNAMTTFAIPRFMAEKLVINGVFAVFNNLDYPLLNRRMGFARMAAIIVDYILS